MSQPKQKQLTDAALVRRHETLSNRISKMIDPLIEAGFGSYRFSDYVSMPAKPVLVSKYIKLVREASDLRAEAEQRYGPGLITIRQLLWRKQK